MRDIPEPIASILPALVEDLRATLGDQLTGIDLYGSALSGGFDPEASDLDLVVVTASDVDRLELAALDAPIRRLMSREPDIADRIDMAYVGRDTLAGFRAGGSVASVSHDQPLEVTADADGWLQTWYLVREADRAIVGPSPRDLIPPIPWPEFAAAVSRNILGLVDRESHDRRAGPESYRLVTLCRVLVSLDRGAVVSKQEAVAEIERREPRWKPLLDDVLAIRLARGRAPFSAQASALAPAFVAWATGEIRTRMDQAAGAATSISTTNPPR